MVFEVTEVFIYPAEAVFAICKCIKSILYAFNLQSYMPIMSQ